MPGFFTQEEIERIYGIPSIGGTDLSLSRPGIPNGTAQYNTTGNPIGYQEWVKSHNPEPKDMYGWDSATGAIGNGLSIVGGLSDIINNATVASQAVKPVGVDSRIGSLNGVVSSSNMSNDDIINGYGNVNRGINTSGYDFRGMTTKDKIGNIGSSVLTGAATGMSVGGPWGALAGAAIGGIGSGLGVINGNSKAKINEEVAKSDLRSASNNATVNLQAAADRNIKRSGTGVIRAAEGGKLTRAAKKKNMSVVDFANKVKAKREANKFSEGGPEGGEIYGGEIAPAVVTPGNRMVLLQTFPVSKDYMISHSALRDAYKDPNKPMDEPVMSISKGVDNTYNLLTNNCSDYTGRFLEDAYGIPMTGGITTPGSIRRKVNDNLSEYIVEEGPEDVFGSYTQVLEMPWYNYRVARDNYYQRAFDDRVKEISKKYGLSDKQINAMKQKWNEQFHKLQWYLDADGNVVRRENSFAEGGNTNTISGMNDYSTHGAIFTPQGFVHIGAGGTHEQNKYGGVPVGVDENGNQNFVEEGENIYNDYVMSDRLKPTKTELKNNNLPEKYHGKTFAEISDLLMEEAKTRTNDPISNAGAGVMLDRLVACHEEHKQKLEAKRAEQEMADMYQLGMLNGGTGEPNMYGPGGRLAGRAIKYAGKAIGKGIGKVARGAGKLVKGASKELVYDSAEAKALRDELDAEAKNISSAIDDAKKAREAADAKAKEYEDLIRQQKERASINDPEIQKAARDAMEEEVEKLDSDAVKQTASAYGHKAWNMLKQADTYVPVVGGPYRNRIPMKDAVHLAEDEYAKATDALKRLRAEGASASEIKKAEEAADAAYEALQAQTGFKTKYWDNGKLLKTAVVGGGGTIGAGVLLHNYIDDKKTSKAAEMLGTMPVVSNDDEETDHAYGGNLYAGGGPLDWLLGRKDNVPDATTGAHVDVRGKQPISSDQEKQWLYNWLNERSGILDKNIDEYRKGAFGSNEPYHTLGEKSVLNSELGNLNNVMQYSLYGMYGDKVFGDLTDIGRDPGFVKSSIQGRNFSQKDRKFLESEMESAKSPFDWSYLYDITSANGARGLYTRVMGYAPRIVYNDTISGSDKRKRSTKVHELTHSLRAIPQRRVISGRKLYLRDGVEHSSYYDDSDEMYARLNQLRYELGLDPNYVVTKEDLDKWREEGYDNKLLNRYTDDSLLQLFNDIASNNDGQSLPENMNYAAEGGLLNQYAEGGLPTNMRYAPVVDAIGKSFLTALQSPDYTMQRAYNDMARNLPNERISYAPGLVGYRYSPVDEQMVANQINANAAASRRAAMNSGVGPNSGSMLVAMNDSVNNAIGANAYTASQANANARNQIAQLVNNAMLQEASGRMQAQSANAQMAMNRAQLANTLLSNGLVATDNDITARAKAITDNTSLAATGLGNIGRENFYMNQINNDTSKFFRANPDGTFEYVGPKRIDANVYNTLLKKPV